MADMIIAPALDPFVDFVVNDLLSGLPALAHRRMFGGYGLYSDGKFLPIIDDGVLYLKADEKLHCGFEEAGSERLRIRPKTVSMLR
ncbi:MAG: TfoX/Sxy family protein [Patescibacteria group bacterium]